MSTLPAPRDDQRPVPVRTIVTTIGLVLLTALLLYIISATRQVLTWIVVAAFLAVALHPVDDWVQRRLLGGRGRRRALATALVFLVVFLVLAGLVAVFAVPLAQEGTKFAGQFPALVADARAGRGPVGSLLERTNALQYVQDHQATITAYAKRLTTPAVGVLGGVATGLAGVATVIVLAYLMVLEGPKVVGGFLNLFPAQRAERLRRVSGDCAKSITGYLSGNLLISIICGVLTYITLKVVGVPFAGLVALFVGIADLIPLVGATIGGVAAIGAGFLHSVTAGIVVLVFFLVYQQLENHVLQPLIFARTVKLNPLTVIIAILLAVELAGVLGSLLAIPVASMIQVIARDVWDGRRGRLKSEPTVGEDERPALSADGVPGAGQDGSQTGPGSVPQEPRGGAHPVGQRA